MLDKVIRYSFYLLFFLTPLFWTSLNNELFEYNKMMLTYAITVVIVGVWTLKMINQRAFIFKRTPLDIFLLLFLGANILSTIFSIDRHISIWGYYSRLNGGLLSLISYLLLYWAFVSNMGWTQVKNILKAGLASGFLISLYAILEHFGVSPSCVILRGEFNASCWIQQVQERVFATLGQPNWLAVYLSMLIFPALYFLLTAQTQKQRIAYYISLIIMYLAFTFTYSRGPTLGLIGGMLVFLFFYFITIFASRMAKSDADKKYGAVERAIYSVIQKLSGAKQTLSERSGRASGFLRTDEPSSVGPRAVGAILAIFLAINLLFGSALTSFRIISKFAAPTRPGISLPTAPSGTQLENGGTESGQIRFIVWKGALDIFKHYPVFGAGLESFAQIYYQYRPVEHNLTSEWDFLYNKAHNEYLNYLATTGIVGFGTYMGVILGFLIWCILKILKSKIQKRELLLIAALSASYVSYLIYDFFLFSVVIIAVFFYVFPALVFVATDSTKDLVLPKKLLTFPLFHFALWIKHLFTTLIYRQPFYTRSTKTIITVTIIYLLYSIFKFWYADTLYARAEKASEAGKPGAAYTLLLATVDLNKREPLYRSELAFAAAQSAISLKETDATLTEQLKSEALLQIEKVLKENPANVSYLRTAVRTYFELSVIDSGFINQTLQALDKSILLAPTDPKLYYNKALVLASIDKKDEEIATLKQALKLKPNYLEVLAQLKEATAELQAKQ